MKKHTDTGQSNIEKNNRIGYLHVHTCTEIEKMKK